MLKHKLKEIMRYRKGFTLFYAALFGSIILLIGASMLNLSLKEFLLSSSIRESEYAFFAADSGTECALYWDLWLLNAFSVTSASPVTRWSDISCNGSPVSTGWTYLSPAIPDLATTPTAATSTFYYNIGDSPNQYCVLVQIGKSVSGDVTNTIIDSRGYNYPCNQSDTRKIERVLITKYPRAF